MHRFVNIMVSTIFIIVLLTSCSAFAKPAPTATPVPTVDQAATQAAAKAMTATQDAASQKTAVVFKTQTAEAEAKAATITAVAQETEDAIKLSTKQAEEAHVAATEFSAQTTQVASGLYEMVAKLYADKVLSTDEGTYHTLQPFDHSWAQINWYQWWPTGKEAENFVLQADASWESASKLADTFTTGCGFVYSENGQDNHYASFLGLDGKVHTYRVKGGIGTEMKSGYYGKVNSPAGKAKLTLAVDRQTMTFYVNEKKVVHFEDKSLTSGGVALTLFSGTNKDYGTRCKMNNVEIWILP